jgi:hypothetical protein
MRHSFTISTSWLIPSRFRLIFRTLLDYLTVALDIWREGFPLRFGVEQGMIVDAYCRTGFESLLRIQSACWGRCL